MVAVATPILIIGWINYSEQYAKQLADGQAYLNIGLYPQAQNEFQQAVDQHPLRRFVAVIATAFSDKTGKKAEQALDLLDLGKEAEWGLEKSKAFESKDNIVIQKTLQQFETEHPDDADVQVLYGKYFLTFKQFTVAEQRFKKAVELKPNTAEAHAGLCEIYDFRNDFSHAIAECKDAIDAANGSAPDRYYINLASLHTESGDYAQALQILDLGDNYLLVKFERGKLFQIIHQAAKAEKSFALVLQGLNDKDIYNTPVNQENWYFKNNKAAMTLHNLADKKCYVTYSYAAALQFNNKPTEARRQQQETQKTCGENEETIKEQLQFDLMLTQENGLNPQTVAEFNRLLDEKKP